jgi:hypothetical protein
MNNWNNTINIIIIGLTMIIVFITAMMREGFEDGIQIKEVVQEKIKESPQYAKWTEMYGVSGSTGFNIPTTNNTTSYDYDHTTQQNNTIVFYGENNSTANVSNNLGQLQIKVNFGNGNTETYNYSQMYDDQIIFIGSGSNKAVMIKTENSMSLTIYSDGNTYNFYSNINENKNKLAGYLNDYYYADDLQTNQSQTNQDTQISSQPTFPKYDYSNYLPDGIPKSAIPYGKEDLYILKSEVVPPVCPICPPPIVVMNDSKSKSKAPPCPACERCPEPIVDCKKVVKYKKDGGGSYGSFMNFNQDAEPVQNIFNQFEEKTKLFEKGKNYKPESSSDGPMPLLNSFSAFGI